LIIQNKVEINSHLDSKNRNSTNFIIKFCNQNSKIQKVMEDNKDVFKSQFNRGNYPITFGLADNLKNWSKTHLSTAILGLLSNRSIFVPDLNAAYDPISKQYFQLIDIKLNYNIRNADIRDTDIRIHPGIRDTDICISDIRHIDIQDTNINMSTGYCNTNEINDDSNINNDNKNHDNNKNNNNNNKDSINNIIMTDINLKRIKIEFTEVLYTIFIKMINKYKEFLNNSKSTDINKDVVQFCITRISTVIFDNQITKLKAINDTNFQIFFDEKGVIKFMCM
jgi:hypothetical protein